MHVEVAYAKAHEHALFEVEVPQDATIAQAIEVSGILDRFPEIDLTQNKVGVFGKLAKLDSPLREGDRVEIYRPLKADPKEVRKRRAAEGKRMGKGGGPVEPESDKEESG
jgi:putative ubiquitin-RnfH superfamily antitoxin RatB of RatAB toxin-antitoxin module